jgi:hypothetical protein
VFDVGIGGDDLFWFNCFDRLLWQCCPI